MTQRHVISLSAQDPEERNRDAKIQILERGRPRVTQKPRAPSPDLLKQTRDQGCGSRGSLPLPSVPPTLQFPAPAQLRLLHIPEAEFSWPWEYVPWDWNPASSLKQLAVCVCVCVCVRARCSGLVPTVHTALPITPFSTDTHCCPYFQWPRSCTPLHTCQSHPHSFQAGNMLWVSLSQTHVHTQKTHHTNRQVSPSFALPASHSPLRNS